MNLIKTAFDSPIVFRLGWTLLHFVWEGALIALMLAALLAVLRRRGAPSRYIACITALLLLAIAPMVTFLLTPSRGPTRLASTPVSITQSPPIDLLNASPVHKTSQVAIPVVSPSPAPHTSAKSPSTSTPKAIPPAPAATTTTFSRTLQTTVDFLPRVLPWLVCAWCAGALILSIYNLGGWMAVRRLRLLATLPVTDDLSAIAARLARQMGITRTIRLLQSTLIDSPMVIGALKPIILLPTSLLTGLSPAQLESLLTHELAHVRRHDYLINLFQGIIETLLFYHPAIWWVSRQIRIERELCCDDQVIAMTQNRTAYVEALAAVAESTQRKGRELSFSRPVKGTGAFAVAASGGALLSRVRRLLGLPDADAARSPRWLAGAVALALCLLATGAIVTRAADKPAPKDKDFDLPKSWILELQVVDKELGEPLPKLALAVRVDNRQFAYTTDEQGRAHVEYPQDYKYIVITPKLDGYVPITISWRNDSIQDPAPDSFKVEMERGTTIGGIVNDESGNPIANAKVQLSIPYKNGQHPRQQLELYNYPIKTDAKGHWHCDVVPADMEQPFVRLNHPDFLSDEMFGETPVPPMKNLRDQTGVMVMKKGLPVNGRVLDTQGKPIAGAHVYQGGDRFGSNYPETKTDADGNFKFAHCRPNAELVLTVTAKGCAPDQKSMTLDKELKDIEFRLEPGHLIKGRVVDSAGKPVPNVMIATDTWRGHRALTVRFDTDAKGHFEWKEAPADEVLTDFLKQGFMDHRQTPIKPSDDEIVITLSAPIHVTGTVVDADTGKPINDFKVIQGIAWPNQPEVTWQRWQPEVHPNEGKFAFDVTSPYPGYAVRIESPDYEPADSRVFKLTESSVSLEFKLKRGRILAGTVHTPDNKPVAGAEVVLCTGDTGPYITNGKITQPEQWTLARTDKEGHYKFPPQSGKFTLVVVHDQGYAEARPEQLAKSFDITMQPWAKIEGTLKIGAKPGTQQTIKVNRQDPTGRQSLPRVYHDLGSSTDNEGHFAVDHVPPGKVSVAVQVQLTQNTYGYTQSQTVNVNAGETSIVNLGGIGRPVVGKFTVPAELAGKMTPANDNTYAMSQISPLKDYRPANWASLDEAARKKIAEDFLKSPEYLQQQKQLENRRQFSIKVHSDGTFRIDDVPAGTYQLVSIASKPDNRSSFSGEAVAVANLDFTVPPMAGDRSDEPLDLGSIDFKPPPKSGPGAGPTRK